MQIPASQALLLLIFALPICVFTFYVDLKYKKISNLTVWALFVVFVGIGLATMPWQDFLWRFAHYAVVFGYGLALWLMRQIGAGDVKFAAVLALYVHLGDLRLMLIIAAAALVSATLTVLMVRFTPLHRLAPHWASWSQGDPDDANAVGGGTKFTIPMGTGLALMLVVYLGLGVFFGT